MATTTPREFRKLVASGGFKNITSGICHGYKQANVAALPKSLAYTFERICESNFGPMPILTKLEDCSAIFREVPKYCKIQNGCREEVTSVASVNADGYVAFLLGCSLSFEGALLNMDIPVRTIEQGKNVSMYRTKIMLENTAYRIPMVVSMRWIPKQNITKAYLLSKAADDCHGAPIGIGEEFGRMILGIPDLSKPDFGDAIHKNPGDVACFWCCGVTGVTTLLEMSKQHTDQIFVTHAPGYMYVTDIKTETADVPSKIVNVGTVEELSHPLTATDAEFPAMVEYHPDYFSPASSTTIQKLTKIDNFLTTTDPGKRGIENFTKPGDFVAASLHLANAKSVLLTTGFPACINFEVPYETDGLPGIMALARCLTMFGKQVKVVVDEAAYPSSKAPFDLVGLDIPVVTLAQLPTDEKFDAILTSERTSRNRETGDYRTMRLQKMDTKFIDPIDDHLNNLRKRDGTLCISIGDGGNEYGMGKLSSPNCTAMDDCDFLVGAGVSNWGCYAFCVALLMLNQDPDFERYARRGLGSCRKFEIDEILDYDTCRKDLAALEKQGVRDGCKPEQSMSVDGLFFEKEHRDVIDILRKMIDE